MSDPQEQISVLCASLAVFSFADGGNRKSFSCSVCGRYQISCAAEKRLSAAPKDWLQSISSLARGVPVDHLLVVLVSAPSRDPAESSAAIECRVVPASNLPHFGLTFRSSGPINRFAIDVAA